MSDKNAPSFFLVLNSDMSIDGSDIIGTSDGFYTVKKSISNILLSKGITDFQSASGDRLSCSRFYDDWFFYAVPYNDDYVYSLLKLREQEQDAEDGLPADGDMPGITISFISFDIDIFMDCLSNPTDGNRTKLNAEINRVVAYRGQCHHNALKKYFKNPKAQGAYLVAAQYVKMIASYANNGIIKVPDSYRELFHKNNARKKSGIPARLPSFIESLNQAAGCIVCDNENVYINNSEELTEYEAAAILSTHTGNTSVYSFAAEVEYHARFLMSLAKIKIPFLGRSIYDSAVRADMTVGDAELQGSAPFYNDGSRIVKRQYFEHSGQFWGGYQNPSVAQSDVAQETDGREENIGL